METDASVGEHTPGRRDEIARNLAVVENRIGAACAAAGRPREDVTLVVVTKTHPASDVRLLAGLGIHDVGENRDQEAAPKAAETAELALVWHYVGQLQTNKAKSVAGYADVVHSLDRIRLASALSAAAARHEREITALLQVSLDGDPSRGGVLPADVAELADTVAALPHLTLGGVMAVAPLGADPARAFAGLREIASRLREAHPAATMVSAGMSNDLEVAIEAGATHVRIGTAVLGVRPSLR
ncbi:YggS family pyridoxal phosphate-dependent enzyme [Streptomyces sp. SID3343]|uniref:YggS family pyridoxal phosphate-dependent enzyme n=1 Tax=Streptomyces sp. SID3343 TaxID=2690260 RepID=UPI00136D4F91|nr:YggS family pyridoxal phosphate-dependent enzyme [Streptomyces sp. SID3343]MYV96690.1 YggS family pyridoxal phosphate-dependent enzyme [Streptomyces sp. SID3343]